MQKCLIAPLLGLLCAASLWAQSPPLTGIAHVAFRVSDLARTREFYRTLGFDQAFEFADAGQVTEAFIKINDQQYIELYPRTQDSQPLGLMHICFGTADIEGLRNWYLNRKLDPSSATKGRAGNLLFSLHDPEGFLIEYVQYLPQSIHSMDHGMHLGGHRISQHISRVTLVAQDLPREHAFYNASLDLHDSLSSTGVMFVPGVSGDEIELQAASENSHPSITLEVSHAGHAAKELRHRGFNVQSTTSVSITDPDGAVIVFASKRR